MRKIKLGKKEVYAIVDDCDFERISAFKWWYTKGKNKYYAIRDRNKLITMANEVMMITGEIDHIDGNSLNNQRVNLRKCSHSDNMKNRTCRSKSGYYGVRKHRNKWVTNFNGKYIGLFNSPENAAKAYNEMVIKSRNQFYNLNNIP